MKKVLVIALAAMLAGGAVQAASVGFDFGTNFFKPSGAGGETGNGSNFLISWQLDNDVALGVYTEQDPAVVQDAGTAAFTVSAIQVSKGVIKNVSVGLNLGSGTEDNTPDTAALVDIFGAVNILSGSGEKINGSLKATVAARFCNTNINMDGVNLGLAVALWF
jgi:hypothetical protein